MNVLVACEESQVVCCAFRSFGHNAYSCDLQDCSGGHPEWHIKGDCIPLIDGCTSFLTCDGVLHYISSSWDLIIAHPPCTYLSNVSNRFFSLNASPADVVVDRLKQRSYAAVFFMRFVAADCQHICIENPKGFMSSAYRPPDQVVNPYEFSSGVSDTDNYFMKTTSLWLKGLPLLITNRVSRPDNKSMFGLNPAGKAYTWTEKVSSNRSVLRSRTFPGVAFAMASQWGDIL